MSLASYKTVLESVTSHEQSVVESSAVMVQRRRSSFVRILPDYIVGPPNLREGCYIHYSSKKTNKYIGSYDYSITLAQTTLNSTL